MRGTRIGFNGDAELLHQHAVRTPLPDEAAEQLFHENMMAVADARERKAELLADPDVPIAVAYETELDRVAESFKRRLRHFAGENYEEIAMAYNRGDRDDRVASLASYYMEGLWRIQQRSTVTDMLFFPLILRYPDSFTVNLRFAGCHRTTASICYESPQYADEHPDDQYAENYYEDSRYEQEQAATYLRQTAQIIREQFPSPDETSFEERKYGGIVSAGGRRGSEFSVMLTSVEPDPDRFEESVNHPVLVPEGEEARRTAAELLPEHEVVV